MKKKWQKPNLTKNTFRDYKKKPTKNWQMKFSLKKNRKQKKEPSNRREKRD